MERVCPACGRDPGSRSLCRHCGARVYRFATDDDFEMPGDDLADDPALAGDDTPLGELAEAEIPEEPTWLPETRTEPTVAEPYVQADESTWVPIPPSRPTPPPAPTPIQAQPTTPKRRGCGCGGCLFILFFLFMVGVVAFSIFARSYDSPEDFFNDVVDGFDTGTLGSAPDEMVGDAAAGPCLDLVIEGSLVVEWNEVPCSGPHDVEQFHTQFLAAGPFPGTDELSDMANDTCYDLFEEYVGEPYVTSEYYYDWLVPTEAGWATGDRELTCTIVSGDGEPLVGSAKDSGR